MPQVVRGFFLKAAIVDKVWDKVWDEGAEERLRAQELPGDTLAEERARADQAGGLVVAQCL